jgi:hypothetical protein
MFNKEKEITKPSDYLLQTTELNKNDSKSFINILNMKKNYHISVIQNSINPKQQKNSSVFNESDPAAIKMIPRDSKLKLNSHEQIQLIDSNDCKINKVILKSSSNNITQSECLKLKPYWLNYSYIVLIASFISFMLASVLSCCFGIFFESMETDMGWSKSQVAFIGGFISALQDLCGPIASAMTNRFGCRKTCMFGGKKYIENLPFIGI